MWKEDSGLVPYRLKHFVRVLGRIISSLEHRGSMIAPDIPSSYEARAQR